MTSPQRNQDKLIAVLDAWSTLRPTKSFYGMTLEQFKAAIKPSLDARSAVDEARKNLTATTVQRDNADMASWPLALGVVSAVVSDPAEGNNGELYKTMGYVRRSERASGLTRNRRKDDTPPQDAKAA